MLKKIIIPLLLMALGNVMCEAQQYFTGTVEYKFLNKDTGADMHMKVVHGNSFINFKTGSQNNSNADAGELIYDWAGGYAYAIDYAEKEIRKTRLNLNKSEATTTRTDSLIVLGGLTARLYRVNWSDQMLVDAWYADSLLTTIPDSLADDLNLAFFGMGRVLLKVEIKKGVLFDSSGFSGFFAAKISPEPGAGVTYTLDPGYRVIDEAEQQRRSDSIMREFKTVDSSLVISSDKQIDSIKRQMSILIDSLKSIMDRNNDSPEDKKPPPAKKRKPAVKKNTARKPYGLP